MNMKKITSNEYTTFDEIFDYLNKNLFNSILPSCMFTMQRKSKTNGYYHKGRFISRQDPDIQIDEIALNPDNFYDRSDIEIISTIAHEMCHLWQFTFGKASRNGYHNKEFSKKMFEIGLQTSNTGSPGGKETGQKMSHYIIENGPFETVIKNFLSDKKKLKWQSFPIQKKINKKISKIKYTCLNCGLNVWGKPEILVKCGICDEVLVSPNLKEAL